MHIAIELRRICAGMGLMLGGLIAGCANPLWAQTGCSTVPPLSASQAPNIFSEQQEVDLGDAIAEQIQRNYRVTSDPELTAYLQRVSDRLLKYLPPNHLNFHFMLLDLSYPNAFSIAGGRVYVSNKIIATARNEDELASILGHELGHLITHQTAIDMTREMGAVLNVTAVSDRRDVFEKYHLLIENRRRRAAAFRKARMRSLGQEEVADHVALVASVRAGYSPQAMVDVFDRISGSEGKTGSWFSDFFGTTTDEARRLREMIKSMGTLPENCVEHSSAGSQADFKRWQEEVVSYSGWERQEALHDVMARVKLQPQLQGTLRSLKFSPDGNYVLAQDDATVFVLSRDPLRPILRFEASDSAPAQFTPDSKAVTINSRRLRVETWDIASAKRVSANELAVPRGCLQSVLAPDGRTLACLAENKDMILFDVPSGAEIDRARSFFTPDPFLYAFFLLSGLVSAPDEPMAFIGMGFSPDGHYFLAASRGTVYAYDFTKHEPFSLPHSIKSHLFQTFAFVGPDRLVAAGQSEVRHVPIFEFPSGQKLAEVDLGTGRPGAAAHGDYVMVRPVRDYGVGVVDYKSGKYVVANKNPAFDVYDNLVVREQRDGEPAIYDIKTEKQFARVVLSDGSLGNLKVAVVSPDLKWLAVSGADRGAVWNLSNGNRTYLMRAFHGAHFGGDASLYVDFPKFEKIDHSIVRVSLDQQVLTPFATINEEFGQQYGSFLLIRKPEKHGFQPGLFGPIEIGLNTKVTWEVRDTLTGQTLWSRYFGDEVPLLYVSPQEGKTVLAWKVTAKAVHEEAQSNPQVRQRLEGVKPDPYDDFLEVIDARSGKFLGSLLVDTGKGSFFIKGAAAAGDWVAVTDNQNRTLLYSLSSGEAKERFFGTAPAILPGAGLLALENERGHLTLYDLSSMESVDQFVFASALVYKAFAADGKRLFVLTADQTAYTLDLNGETVP